MVRLYCSSGCLVGFLWVGVGIQWGQSCPEHMFILWPIFCAQPTRHTGLFKVETNSQREESGNGDKSGEESLLLQDRMSPTLSTNNQSIERPLNDRQVDGLGFEFF